MSPELRLGFHRLGRWFEEPFNLGIAVIVVWVIAVWLVALRWDRCQPR